MKKTAVITGGSRGIGRCLVERLSAEMNVVFFYLSSDAAAKSLEEKCGAVAMKVDVSDEKAVERAMKSVFERFGSIDVLVNNAGVELFGRFQDVGEESKKLYAVNLFGPLNCTREASKYMIMKKNGAIVNVSSVWGRTGASYEVDYSTSKGALLTLTRSLAKELGRSGIRVNSVSPGMIDTDMNKNLTEDEKSAFLENTALCRIGSPDEVVNAIYFLASDDSSYITGADLPVDGLVY